MNPIENLRALVNSDRDGLTGVDLLELQRRIAGERFHLATIVAQKKRAYMQAELDRKALVILRKTRAKVETAKITGKPLSETAATDMAEEHPDVREARAKEIDAEMEFEEARLTLATSGDVLSSLQMRIADARDERRTTRLTQTP